MTRSDPAITTVDQRATAVEPAFCHVLCGLDHNPPSAEAARQAVALARPGGKVEFLAITGSGGTAAEGVPVLSDERAGRALEEACRQASSAGVPATHRIVRSSDPTSALLEESAGHDLLAVGTNNGSRAANIFLGRTASALVHRAGVPVLVARPAPADAPFAKKILLASDGSLGSDRAAVLATRIASAHHPVAAIIHVSGTKSVDRQALARQTRALREAAGYEPSVVETSGDADDQIAAHAIRLGVSLVVIGSRGLEGVRTCQSVSERVVRECPCSVLVARPDGYFSTVRPTTA